MDAVHLTTAHKSTDTRIFDKEATSLADAGFDVGILAHDAPEGERNGVQFTDLGSAPSRTDRWWSIPKVARIAKQLDASVYHFHDPELIPVGLYLTETTDGAVVYDVHEDYSHVVTTREWIPNTVSEPLSYVIPKVERAAAKRFDAIVAVSDWIAAPLRKLGPPVTVAHNFPRTETLQPATERIEREQTHVLCYVGGIQELRGIYRMLDLLRVLRNRGVDVELWVLGAWSPDENHAQVAQFVQQHELEDYVQFPGYLDYEKMFQYLHSADVGIALLDTNHYKRGVPTKFFEYLYAGLPIVTTPVDAVSKFMPEEFCQVVSQGDAETAADAVEAALQEDHNASEMRALVGEKYSWEHESAKIINLYDHLLDENPRKQA
ncbi:glycosyltransferase family 4 protein [Halobacterium salinarum]|uniref:Glycosyltransferase involved in cell wall bisynthesis n=1 Tax=Halobacterium salinarum (strain ATCC 33171 / DSM 3754 / JCM 8978 / NBRC 102687 / NCIMB 764 / 91-R6) TaxID=2597657 RepID=A0A4D6GQR4_HALS9|nr:glycosyltransferase family 4 protein [Halobacterium salinarum]QCC43993.1 putative glycosyltransferase, type 1 [Halobacterium salinarum]TYO71779.1 Glycosyltransferase involved in cell wall bisynthesis [Halobacterium salinarum DSM 3754]